MPTVVTQAMTHYCHSSLTKTEKTSLLIMIDNDISWLQSCLMHEQEQPYENQHQQQCCQEQQWYDKRKLSVYVSFMHQEHNDDLMVIAITMIMI
jgi:hypothetical protein